MLLRILILSMCLSAAMIGQISSPMLGGGAHTFAALKSDGVITGWGRGGSGALGQGTTTAQSTPAVLAGLPRLKKVATRFGSHTVALTHTGDLYVWGWNAWGQLGLGDQTDRLSPVLLTGLPPIADIETGRHFCLARATDGTWWAWGYNEFGQFGMDTPQLFVPTPVQVPGLSGLGITSYTIGHSQVMGLTAGGDVYVWGRNHRGQLGIGTTVNQMTPLLHPTISAPLAIATGLEHSAVVTAAGQVLTMGSNNRGQLGIGTVIDESTPQLVAGLTNVVAFYGGLHASYAVHADGTVSAWGRNNYGALGLGTTTDELTPQSVPGLAGISRVVPTFDSCAFIDQAGALQLCGRNHNGQLGLGDLVDRHVPTPLPGFRMEVLEVGVAATTVVGSSMTFTLTTLPALPGRSYLFDLSFSGSVPGIPLPAPLGGGIPLNPPLGFAEYGSLAPSLFNGFIGTLDAGGSATASLFVPADPGLAGITFTGAAVVLDAGAPLGLDQVSSASATTLTGI